MIARSPAPLVLVADADPYICRVFEAKLTKDNQFRVLSARTAQEAYLSALQNAFDAILWDSRLRDSSHLLARLRALSPNAVLILMTTDDMPPPLDTIAYLDIADVLTKPFGLDTLVEKLRSWMSVGIQHPSLAYIDIGRIGQRVLISSPQGDCVTRVLDSGLDTFVVVGAPRVETPADFNPGLKVKVRLQGTDALYSFDSALARATSDPVSGWELRMPRAIRRVQRRKSLRAVVHVDLRVTPVNPESSGAFSSVTAVTEDLSSGGCAFYSPEPLLPGSTVTYELRGADGAIVTGEAQVMRNEPVVANDDSVTKRVRYRVALRFNALSPTERRRLKTILKI